MQVDLRIKSKKAAEKVVRHAAILRRPQGFGQNDRPTEELHVLELSDVQWTWSWDWKQVFGSFDQFDVFNPYRLNAPGGAWWGAYRKELAPANGKHG